MNRLTRHLLLISFLLSGVMGLNAQNNKLIIGLKGGINVSNWFMKEGESPDSKIGFNFGVSADYEMVQNLFLLTGLEVTTKGVKEKENYAQIGSAKATANLIYLQIPIHLGYKLLVSNTTKLVFHAGPYIGCGVGGKITFEGMGEKLKLDSFSDDGVKRFDFGLGLGFGAEFNKVGIGIGYDFGLINISQGVGNAKNGNFYASVGYKFNL